MINASTKLCCLIGCPVAHSVSPQMHNAAFKALGLNYVYLAFEVAVEDLEKAVRGLKAIGVAGFNVTIPHKINVMKYLDELDESAEETGAVNTVASEDGLLIGYNTDVYGVMKALEGFNLPKTKPALIIGAGGAARAAANALMKIGFNEIVIANRTIEKARQLADWIKSTGRKAHFHSLDRLGYIARGCGVIINATSIGMLPHANETLLTSKDIPENSIVLDLVYNPPKTKLLREAERAGAKIISGIEVLIHQGARAFELWTRCKAPIDVMRKAVLAALEAEYRESSS